MYLICDSVVNLGLKSQPSPPVPSLYTQVILFHPCLNGTVTAVGVQVPKVAMATPLI